jgi:hypothetical protein
VDTAGCVQRNAGTFLRRSSSYLPLLLTAVSLRVKTTVHDGLLWRIAFATQTQWYAMGVIR